MGSGFWSIMLYLQEPLETGPSTGVGKESRYAVYAPNDYMSRVRRRRSFVPRGRCIDTRKKAVPVDREMDRYRNRQLY